MTISEVIALGTNAHLEGLPATANPYIFNSVGDDIGHYYLWLNGWMKSFFETLPPPPDE